MRLRELEWRYADFALQRATKMAFAHTQVVSEVANAASVECACGNAVGSDIREARHRVDDCSARSKLGAETQAGTEPCAFSGCGRVEESAVVGVRHARRTDWPTIDVRGCDPDEEESVEARISSA
jgi:hypothetical protein